MRTATHPLSSADAERLLIRAAHSGDWALLTETMAALDAEPLAHTTAALHDRARVLEEALTAARAARADLSASLVRLTAAGRFAQRQDFAGPAEIRHLTLDRVPVKATT